MKPNGIRNGKFRSLFESNVALQLRSEKFIYEPKDRKLPFIEERTYLPDFYLPEYDTYVECKGYFTASDRTKMLLIKEQHPNIKIVFVFMNAMTKLSKSSKTTYALWCEKHGFRYVNKIIPKDFIWK